MCPESSSCPKFIFAFANPASLPLRMNRRSNRRPSVPSELERIHETRVGELAIASGETKMSRETALEKKSVKARKLENEESARATRTHDGCNSKD